MQIMTMTGRPNWGNSHIAILCPASQVLAEKVRADLFDIFCFVEMK